MKCRWLSIPTVVLCMFITHPAAAEERMTQALMELSKKSGCLVCHGLNKKIIGPSWKDVAERYRGNGDARAILIKSVKNGGKGKWLGETGGVKMPPHSPEVSDADIETLVDHILNL